MSKLLLILPVGIPGSGKTTICKRLSIALEAEHIWVDAHRKERFGDTFSSAQSSVLYEELNQYADELLAAGRNVIYDTAFNYYRDRERLRSIAQKHGAHTVILWVKTPYQIAHDRAVKLVNAEDNRILGSMDAEYFKHLVAQVEDPRSDEVVVEVEGVEVKQSAIDTAVDAISIL